VAAEGQPTNATNPRQAVQGEAQAIQEQQQSAPIGPEQRGRPAGIPTMPAMGPLPNNAAPNSGLIGDVVPARTAVAHSRNARPTTPLEGVGIALLGLPGASPLSRRLAMHLTGVAQPNMVTETPRRTVGNPFSTEDLQTMAQEDGGMVEDQSAEPAPSEQTPVEGQA
jgi:hypothetical protein